jgi:cytochrome c
MSWLSRSFAIGLAAVAVAQPLHAQPPGKAPSAADLAAWDIDVRPDGAGLPPGRGSAVRGAAVYAENCSACHGEADVGGPKDRLVGGQGSLASAHPIKTIGSYWPYATTLFDYVRRAMPYQAPGSLGSNDTYAVVAYLLSLNGIVDKGAVLDARSLPKVRMPNRDGFVPDPEFSQPKPASATKP